MGIIEFLGFLVAGVCDRVRGGYPEGRRPKWVKFLAKSAIGPCLLLSVTNSTPLLVAALGAGHLSHLLSNSWRGEWVEWLELVGVDWDSEILQTALGFGVWAGVPYALIGFWEPALWQLAAVLIWAAPLSALVGSTLPAIES